MLHQPRLNYWRFWDGQGWSEGYRVGTNGELCQIIPTKTDRTTNRYILASCKRTAPGVFWSNYYPADARVPRNLYEGI